MLRNKSSRKYETSKRRTIYFPHRPLLVFSFKVPNNYNKSHFQQSSHKFINRKRDTFETMVPQSDSTCRNFGVLGNAQTKRVQSEFQSSRYSAPISSACERKMPRSGFTNPDNTNTTPSCPYKRVTLAQSQRLK